MFGCLVVVHGRVLDEVKVADGHRGLVLAGEDADPRDELVSAALVLQEVVVAVLDFASGQIGGARMGGKAMSVIVAESIWSGDSVASNRKEVVPSILVGGLAYRLWMHPLHIRWAQDTPPSWLRT